MLRIELPMISDFQSEHNDNSIIYDRKMMKFLNHFKRSDEGMRFLYAFLEIERCHIW